MRIESSTYSRNLISNLPQQQAQKNDETRVQNQKQVEKPQQNSTTKPGQINTGSAQIEVNLNNLPKSLDEVISPEEKGMLDELFPGNGGNWGVGAYKMSNSAAAGYSVGTKLDLTT